MSHMANGAFGNIRALVARDLLDAVRNPTTLMSCGAGALFTAFIGGVVATSSRLTPGEADAFAQVAVFCIAPAFAGCVIELYVMAEERERGAYVTLVEAGVTAGEIAVSKWLSAVLVTLATQIVSCLLLGLAPARAALLLGLSAVGVQPLLFAGLVAGLSAREQMSSSLLAVPLTVVALAPILAFMSGTVRAITWFWPLGPVAEALCAATGMEAAAPMPAAWLAVAAAGCADLLPHGRLFQLRVHIEGRHQGRGLLPELLRLLRLHIAGGALRNGDALPAALAVAQNAHLTVVIALQRLRRTVQADLHGLPQQVHALHIAGAVRRLNKGFCLGHPLGCVLIDVLLVFQAAHQPPAGAGDLGGIEGEVLGLCHLNGYRLELVQELGTAEGPAADAQAAQHLGLVPHTDLPQLDAGMDGAGQVLHQGPEVHPAFRREEEEHLVSLKAVLRLHQLHLQAVGGDLLLTDLEGLCLLLPVFSTVFSSSSVAMRTSGRRGWTTVSSSTWVFP